MTQTSASHLSNWSSVDVFDPERSLALMRSIKDALHGAGLPHRPSENAEGPSVLRRGALTGLTTARGSTGFSVRPDPDSLNFNVVVSGHSAGIEYRPIEKVRQGGEVVTMMEPLNAEILCPKIAEVFEGLSFGVREVRKAPVPLMWADDIDYAITTDPLPSSPDQEHDLISEMVELASFEVPAFGNEKDLEKSRTARAIYFALQAVPPTTLALHLDEAQVKQLIRRARREGAAGEHEHWLAVQRAQRTV